MNFLISFWNTNPWLQPCLHEQELFEELKKYQIALKSFDLFKRDTKV